LNDFTTTTQGRSRVRHYSKTRTNLTESPFLQSDYAWHENLSEWVTLSNLFPPQNPAPTWRDDEATEKQIEYIKSFGVGASVGLTKAQASDLVEQLKNDPDAQIRQQQLREQEQKRKQILRENEERDRELYQSYYTKVELSSQRGELEKALARPDQIKESIKSLRAQIKELKKQLENIPSEIELQEDEIEDLDEERKNLPEEIKDLKEEIKESETNRIDFWLFSFKFDSMGEYGEPCSDLYERFGNGFKCPSKKILSEILRELDEENFEWDKQDLSAFYRRLQQLHPELKKKC